MSLPDPDRGPSVIMAPVRTFTIDGIASVFLQRSMSPNWNGRGQQTRSFQLLKNPCGHDAGPVQDSPTVTGQSHPARCPPEFPPEPSLEPGQNRSCGSAGVAAAVGREGVSPERQAKASPPLSDALHCGRPARQQRAQPADRAGFGTA